MNLLTKFKSYSKMIWSDHFSITKIEKNPIQLQWKEELSQLESFQKKLGLSSVEERAVNRVFRLLPRQLNILVMECGLGREAFALEQMGANVIAIDHNPILIERAKKMAKETNSKVQFYECLWNVAQQSFKKTAFDIILVGRGMPNYVFGRTNRVKFFDDLNEIMSQHTRLILTPHIKTLEWKSFSWWASQILKIRWQKKGLWEEGDTGVCTKSNDQETKIPSFYHLYPTPKHIQTELEEAGLNGHSLSDSSVWIAHKSL